MNNFVGWTDLLLPIWIIILTVLYVVSQYKLGESRKKVKELDSELDEAKARYKYAEKRYIDYKFRGIDND